MAILGLDFGDKKIGLAKAAPGTPAVPLAVWQYTNRHGLPARLGDLCQQEGIDAIVIGLPLPVQAGVSSGGVDKVKQFAEAVRAATGLPVHLHDERLTTKEAQRLHRGSRGDDDATAAMLILQAWIDRTKMEPEAGSRAG